MKFDTIIAIASGQPDPLILPFLSPDINCKHLLLLVTEQIKQKGTVKNIIDTLQPRGIAVSCTELPSSEWGAVEQALQHELKNYAGKVLAFNANGGTKPMTLAAYEYCYNESIPVFYVDGNRFDWLYKTGEQELTETTITQSLSIDTFLRSHGYKIIDKEMPLNTAKLKEMVASWVSQDFRPQISELNNIAGRANKHNLRVELESHEKDQRKEVYDLLEGLEDNSLLKIKGDYIQFASEEARFFANGGWYELHLLKLLETINAKHFEGKGKVLAGITLRPNNSLKAPNEKIKNEIDVAYILNNRLYLFECKTSNLSKKLGRADEAIYKLGTLLKNIGGLNAKGFIVSYHPITEIDKERAELLDINIIEHQTNQENMIRALISGIRQVGSRL
ncbi:MAG: hypothetical protein ACJAW1_003050 [Glaciecola sp.]|jgi:hypothetical protein